LSTNISSPSRSANSAQQDVPPAHVGLEDQPTGGDIDQSWNSQPGSKTFGQCHSACRFALHHQRRQPVDDPVQAVPFGKCLLPSPSDVGAQVGQDDAQVANADLAADYPSGIGIQLEQVLPDGRRRRHCGRSPDEAVIAQLIDQVGDGRLVQAGAGGQSPHENGQANPQPLKQDRAVELTHEGLVAGTELAGQGWP
jgi:hypothetical protein